MQFVLCILSGLNWWGQAQCDLVHPMISGVGAFKAINVCPFLLGAGNICIFVAILLLMTAATDLSIGNTDSCMPFLVTTCRSQASGPLHA